MPQPRDSVWRQPEAAELHLRMVGEGASAGEITAALRAAGFVVSRSAVHGRAHRLGLSIGGTSNPAQAHQRAAQAQAERLRAAAREVEMARRDAERAAADQRRREAEAERNAARAEARAAARLARSAVPKPPAALPADEADGGVPFLAVAADGCRYGLRGSGVGLVVCGARQAPGRSYCPAHARLCYVAPPARALRAPPEPSRARPERPEREADLVDLVRGGGA